MFGKDGNEIKLVNTKFNIFRNEQKLLHNTAKQSA